MTTKSYRRNQKNVTYRFERYNYSSTGVPAATSDGAIGTNETLVWDNTVTGGENPWWRNQIRLGVQAGTSLSGSKVLLDMVPGQGEVTWDEYHSVTKALLGHAYERHVGQLVRFSQTDVQVPQHVTVSDPSNRALVDFYKKARNRQRTLSGGVVVGELLQTLRMIRRPAYSLRKGLEAYLAKLKKAKRKYRRPSDRKKVLADTWLEYSFGWAPLIGDTKDAFEALVRLYEGRPEMAYVRGFAASEGSQAFPTSIKTAGSYLRWFEEKTRKTQRVVEYYGQVKTWASGSVGKTSLFGFDIRRDFAPTAWELVPWSFLVDYFSNVGEVIEAASFVRSDIAWMSKRDRTTTQTIIHGRWDPTAGSTLATTTKRRTGSSGNPGSGTQSYETIVRSNAVPTIPSLEFEISLGPQKFLNLAALGVSLRSLRPFY